MDVIFANLIISLRLESKTVDPFALFAVKGSFEAAFRQALDCRLTGCEGCNSFAGCPGYPAFSRALSPDPAALRKFQKPSAPFIFHPSVVPASLCCGAVVELGLTLIGQAVNHVALYIRAIHLMLGNWRSSGLVSADIISVSSIGYQGERHAVDDPVHAPAKALVLLSLDGLIKSACPPSDAVRLSLDAPLRLLQNGRPLRRLSASSFLRALMRRVSSLVYYFCEIELEADYKWLAGQSGGVSWEEADFKWVEWSRSLSGVTGTGILHGELTEFLPFLLLGEHFNVGKGATFGMGSYRLVA